jgi:hypothetical protein
MGKVPRVDARGPETCTAAIVLLLLTNLTGCGLLGEEGSGVIVTRRIRITDQVDRVVIGDAFRATIRVGAPSPSGTVRIDDNLVDRLRIEVDGDALSIDLDGQVRDATLQAELGLARLERVSAEGASEVRVDGPVTDDLMLDASGASTLDIASVDLDELVSVLSGASEATIGGTASTLDAEVSGASQLSMYETEVEEAHLELSGASTAEVTVLDLLEASASGASSVRYRGEPDRVVSDVSGASTVSSV